jgi:ATP-dependent Clp protease ATP-binding subunit ClpA
MFKKFTRAARAVIFFARFEADLTREQYIEPEYLLLGILDINERPSFGGSVFKDRLTREHVLKYLEPHDIELDRPKVVDLALAAETRAILANAGNYADAQRHNTIGPIHFLYGMMWDENGPLFRIISEAGITMEEIKQEAARIQSLDVAT